jgi:hypothetical protein
MTYAIIKSCPYECPKILHFFLPPCLPPSFSLQMKEKFYCKLVFCSKYTYIPTYYNFEAAQKLK